MAFLGRGVGPCSLGRARMGHVCALIGGRRQRKTQRGHGSQHCGEPLRLPCALRGYQPAERARWEGDLCKEGGSARAYVDGRARMGVMDVSEDASVDTAHLQTVLSVLPQSREKSLRKRGALGWLGCRFCRPVTGGPKGHQQEPLGWSITQRSPQAQRHHLLTPSLQVSALVPVL